MTLQGGLPAMEPGHEADVNSRQKQHSTGRIHRLKNPLLMSKSQYQTELRIILDMLSTS